MGDCLRASKPSRYLTSHLGQLSLTSVWEVNRVLAYLAGVKAGRVARSLVSGGR